MWDRLKQPFASHYLRVFLIYHTNDAKDAAFFKRTLEESYICQVDEYAWNGMTPLTEAITSHTAKTAFLVLFVLSNSFLADLDPEGREAFYQSAAHFQKERNKNTGKAVFIRPCNNQQELREKLNSFACYEQDEEARRKNFISLVKTPGLIRRSEKRVSPASEGDNQQTGTIVAENIRPSALVDTSLPSFSASTPQRNQIIWAVPREHQKPDFSPSAVILHNRATVPREDVLTHIYKMFHNNHKRRKYGVLHGMTGTGKTTLAIHYAYKYGRHHNRPRSHRNPYCVVLWLDATEGLDQGYSALSKYDGVPSDDDQANSSSENPLKGWLENVVEKELKDEERWLLIIDGCRDEEFNRIEELFPWPSNKGDVLITMHPRPEPNDDIYALEVQQLSYEDSANLLAYRIWQV